MNSILDNARHVFDMEIAELKSIRNSLDENFEKVVCKCKESLDSGGKIVVSGIGKSGHIGYKICSTLASTGSHATFLHPVEAMHGDLGILQKKDILLAISYSGETDELLMILPSAKRLEIPIVAITGNENSRLAKWANIVLLTRVEKEACPFNLAPTCSTTVQLVVGDALAMALLDIRGFTKEDFGRLHPGGAIGRAVTLRVSDIMRTSDSHRLVKVPAQTTIKDTILEMTRLKSGSAIIVDEKGRLLGIFTDGDLRRHFGDITLLDKPIEMYMTPRPVTIYGDQLAVDALKLIEKRKVDDIVVIDRNELVLGLVDSQDLPSFKLL